MRLFLTLFILMPAGVAWSTPKCGPLFESHSVRLTSLPSQIEKIFSQFETDLPFKPNNGKIKESLEALFLKEMEDSLDFQDPQGRYARVTRPFLEETGENKYLERYNHGDLKPLKNYVTEITADKDGRPLSEPVLPYLEINTALRRDLIDLSLKKRIAELDQALSKLPDIQGIVFRGTRITKTEFQALQSQKMKELKEPAFMSTTVDLRDANDFLIQHFSTSKDKIPTLMIIRMKNGKAISMGSVFAREEEILLPRGSEFKIAHSFLDYPLRDTEGLGPQVLYLFLDQTH